MSLSEYVRREDLKTLYALPMKEASKKLGVSESSLRNICRKHNIERWPYRKFQQLDAHIASLQNVEVSQQSQQQKEMIESLLRARSILEDNPNMTCEMAILQANKQLLANNPQSGSQVHEMTAHMMNMMMNQNPMEDASPTITGESSPNLDSNHSPINGNRSQTTFVPSYPTHVTSHLSASAALSAMARRKKNPQYSSTNTSSPSILDSLEQSNPQHLNNVIHHQQLNHLNNNQQGNRSISMFTLQSNPTIEIQQPNRYTESDAFQISSNNTSSTNTSSVFVPSNQQVHHHALLNQYPIHSRCNSENIFSTNSSNYSMGYNNNPSADLISSSMGERRGAVSHRDSLALNQGFVLFNNQNNGMDESESSEHGNNSSNITPVDPYVDQHSNPSSGGMIDYQLMDSNLKSRHISLMKQQRRQSPQPPRSLSTSTALPLMRSSNSTLENSPNGSSGSVRKFTSSTTPSSSMNSSLRSSTASQHDIDPTSSSLLSTTQFLMDSMMQTDQEGDISMGDNFMCSPTILINNRLSDDSLFHQRNTTPSSLTQSIPLNRFLHDNSPNHDFDFVSKQEQREQNHRILEVLRITPTTPSNCSNNYDPLFDSNAFLRGRTSSVSSTFSDTMSTPMTPTTEGRLSNASSLRLSHGMNSDYPSFSGNY